MNRRLLTSLFAAAAAALAVATSTCKDRASAPPDPLAGLAGADAAYQHTRDILAFGPRPPGSAALKKTRDYLVAQLRARGWHAGAQTVEATVPGRGPVTFTNLIARFGSSDDPDFWKRPVTGLLAGHLDSKYYPDRRFLGADDAASAVGAILELARQLAASPDLASRLELVFFDGEESFGPNISPRDGLYGSKAYAARWRTSSNKPKFGIVLDMIGHENLRIRYPSDTPLFLEKALLDAARPGGHTARFSRGDTPILDDHVPLNDAGIPTIDIIGDFSQFAWWHTEGDNLANISKESLAITLDVTMRMLEALLAE